MDAQSIARYANNENVSRFVRDLFPYPYRVSDALGFIERVSQEIPPACMAITLDDEAIGATGLILGEDIYRRSAEIGYWLGEPFWGRGIASEAVKGLVEYGFRQFDLVRIHAEVFDSNPASARVLEKAGFVLEGRLRSALCKRSVIYDALLYAVLREVN